MPDSGSTQVVNPFLIDKQGWDEYWNKENQGGVVYASIASFYRKQIIRPCLNRVIYENFPPGAKLLHAGCGSGQVDSKISFYAKVTGLDIASSALSLYETNTGGRCTALLGNILNISLPDETFDGVYNLGVLEHFSEEDIGRMLREFHRVLRPGGKLVVFWPPAFGLSVMFFKLLSGVFRIFANRQTHFHPEEVSHLKSRQYGAEVLAKAGFELVKYTFGPQDLWTHAILVATKTHCGTSSSVFSGLLSQ